MKGHSRKIVSKNIRELMHAYKAKGSIGTSRPKTKAKARKQAIAIAFSEARRSK